MSQYLDISLQQDQDTLSAQQKKFNRFFKKIDQQRVLLAEWQQAQQEIQQRASQELLPAYAQLHQLFYQQLEMLWQHKLTSRFTARQKDLLDASIENIASQLLQVNTLSELQMTEVEKIFHYFQPHDVVKSQSKNIQFDDSPSDTDQSIELKKQLIKQQICMDFGVEVEFIDFDFDLHDIDGLIQKLNHKIEQQMQEEFLKYADEAEKIHLEKQMQRARAKEKKQQEHAQKMATQSLKTIYSKIAAAIHPDRELDEFKKIEKTEMLQLTNQAYENKDLLTLLKLQNVIENDASKKRPYTDDEQLKIYNFALEAQLKDLENAIQEIINSFNWNHEASSLRSKKIGVKDLYKKYKSDLKEVQNRIEHAEFLLKHSQDLDRLKSLITQGYF